MFGRLLTMLMAFLHSHPAILDGLKLAAVGVFIETCRRGFQYLASAIATGLTVTVRIKEDDDSFDWLEYWLSTHCMDPTSDDAAKPSADPSLWTLLLEQIWPTGRTSPRDLNLQTSSGNVHTRMTQAVRYKGKTLWVKIYQTQEEWGSMRNWIQISSFLGTSRLFDSLIHDAKTAYIVRDEGKLLIFTPSISGYDYWRRSTAKPSRPWESVILPKDLKEAILGDAKEFMNEAGFYHERGLPYKRGYLLYGVPGAGKSSLISALAAELKLKIYIVNLNSAKLDDACLQRLLHICPERCILLMEDIDCAVSDRQHKEDIESSGDRDKKAEEKNKRDPPRSSVTLSGLLNALDGVASSEGRLLFCTTNHIDKVDPALSRPGRCDVWIEFTNATKTQAHDLFLHFYPPESLQVSTITPEISHPANIGSPNDLESSPAATASLREKTISAEHLAAEFADKLPEGVVSVSALQAYLMRFKRRPEAAVLGVDAWVAGGFKQGPSCIFGSKVE